MNKYRNLFSSKIDSGKREVRERSREMVRLSHSGFRRGSRVV